MPKYALVWSRQADQELDDIVDYIAEQNPWAAIEFAREVEKKTLLLQEHPQMYRPSIYKRGYRYMLIGNYLFLYKAVSEDRTVKVMRVLHGARDIATALGENT